MGVLKPFILQHVWIFGGLSVDPCSSLYTIGLAAWLNWLGATGRIVLLKQLVARLDLYIHQIFLYVTDTDIC